MSIIYKPFSPTLRTRKAMIDFLLTQSHGIREARAWQGDGVFRFCFNVKCRMVDFSFKHLLEIITTQGIANPEPFKDADYVQRLHEKYNEEFCEGGDTAQLWEAAIEICREQYAGNDEYILSNGKTVKTEWQFLGRSGGWLVLSGFEGYDLATNDTDVITSMPWKDLRRLAYLVEQVEYELKPPKVREEIEYQAASLFFGHMCEKVERPNAQLAAGI